MSPSAAPDRNQQEAPPQGGEPLAGRRVLIVEDDPFIAMAVEETLLDFGIKIAGVARNLREAEQLARVADFDIALLDVNIGHDTIDGVADAVHARGKPFVFTTGHGRAGLPEAYRERAIVEKPFYVDEILSALRAELGLA
jgi:DNA-binding response OmpR family regulator